jgi:DNA-binding CsgD family transcriptional regulator
VSGATRQVTIYVRDPDFGVPIDVESLRQRYSLTPAEARTAVALVRGGTLQHNSELLKLRPMTIRGYIKQVFAKTTTHSQLDLLRLVLTGTSSIAGDRLER